MGVPESCYARNLLGQPERFRLAPSHPVRPHPARSHPGRPHPFAGASGDVSWAEVQHWMWPLFSERWRPLRIKLGLAEAPLHDKATNEPVERLPKATPLVYGVDICTYIIINIWCARIHARATYADVWVGCGRLALSYRMYVQPAGFRVYTESCLCPGLATSLFFNGCLCGCA